VDEARRLVEVDGGGAAGVGEEVERVDPRHRARRLDQRGEERPARPRPARGGEDAHLGELDRARPGRHQRAGADHLACVGGGEEDRAAAIDDAFTRVGEDV